MLYIEDLPESVRRLILNKAEGNPFFVEEVIRTLIDSSYIVRENSHWRATRRSETSPSPIRLQACSARASTVYRRAPNR